MLFGHHNRYSRTIPAGLDIRRYQNGDRDAVWALHKLALDGAAADPGDEFHADLREIGSVYLASGGDFLVASLRGRLIAMGGFTPVGPGRVELKRMRVHPRYQRQGIGRLLLESLAGSVRLGGHAVICLETTLLQTAARRLYSAAGYREVARGRTLGFEVVRYEKTLQPPR